MRDTGLDAPPASTVNAILNRPGRIDPKVGDRIAAARSFFSLAFSSSKAFKLPATGNIYATVIRLLAVKARLGYSIPAADIGRPPTALLLLRHLDDLLVRKPARFAASKKTMTHEYRPDHYRSYALLPKPSALCRKTTSVSSEIALLLQCRAQLRRAILYGMCERPAPMSRQE